MSSYDQPQEQYANLSTAALTAKQYGEANNMTSPARNKPAGCNWDGVCSLYRYAGNSAEGMLVLSSLSCRIAFAVTILSLLKMLLHQWCAQQDLA